MRQSAFNTLGGSGPDLCPMPLECGAVSRKWHCQTHSAQEEHNQIAPSAWKSEGCDTECQCPRIIFILIHSYSLSLSLVQAGKVLVPEARSHGVPPLPQCTDGGSGQDRDVHWQWQPWLPASAPAMHGLVTDRPEPYSHGASAGPWSPKYLTQGRI